MITLDISKADAEWLGGWFEQLLGPLTSDDITGDTIRISGIRKALSKAVEGDTTNETNQ